MGSGELGVAAISSLVTGRPGDGRHFRHWAGGGRRVLKSGPVVGDDHPTNYDLREPVIKADIVDRIVEHTDLPRGQAATTVDTILITMRDALGRGQRIELRGFGVFQVKARKRGIGRNPRTGVEVPIKPGKTVRFKPGKFLRSI